MTIATSRHPRRRLLLCLLRIPLLRKHCPPSPRQLLFPPHIQPLELLSRVAGVKQQSPKVFLSGFTETSYLFRSPMRTNCTCWTFAHCSIRTATHVFRWIQLAPNSITWIRSRYSWVHPLLSLFRTLLLFAWLPPVKTTRMCSQKSFKLL